MGKDSFEGWLGLAGAAILTAAIGGAVFVWGWQLLAFLKTGHWIPYSATDGLFYLTDNQWFFYPETWKGVHQILNFFNAGVALVIAAIAGLVAAQAAIST